MNESTHPLLILVAGPYRSGTNDDPALIHQNVDAMRIGGPSGGADEMVRIGKEKGKRIVYGLEEVYQSK